MGCYQNNAGWTAEYPYNNYTAPGTALPSQCNHIVPEPHPLLPARNAPPGRKKGGVPKHPAWEN
jgi:hypothetical protein